MIVTVVKSYPCLGCRSCRGWPPASGWRDACWGWGTCTPILFNSLMFRLGYLYTDNVSTHCLHTTAVTHLSRLLNLYSCNSLVQVRVPSHQHCHNSLFRLGYLHTTCPDSDITRLCLHTSNISTVVTHSSGSGQVRVLSHQYCCDSLFRLGYPHTTSPNTVITHFTPVLLWLTFQVRLPSHHKP